MIWPGTGPAVERLFKGASCWFLALPVPSVCLSLLLNQVFDILPLYGTLRPNESQQMTFTFYGHADIVARVKALCEVEGGPAYRILLTGEASVVSYMFDKKEIDYGLQVGAVLPLAMMRPTIPPVASWGGEWQPEKGSSALCLQLAFWLLLILRFSLLRASKKKGGPAAAHCWRNKWESPSLSLPSCRFPGRGNWVEQVPSQVRLSCRCYKP